jgi:hypothetical protein
MNLAQFEHTDEGLAWMFDNPLALLAIGAVLWWVSLRIWPAKLCKRCKGSGYRSGLIGARVCGKCGGGGLVKRVGARDD